MLHQGRAAFHPVAVVQVEHAAHLPHLGVVDVAAHHAIESTPPRLAGQGVLEPVDRLHGVLHPALQPGRQRPVRMAQAPADRVEVAVQDQGRGIRPVSQQCEELGIAHHAVELVAMHDQQAAAVGRGVLGFVAQLHPRYLEPHRQPGAEHLVMVARDVGDGGAGLRLLQDEADDLVVRRVPIPGFPQPPTVDDVADEIERLTGTLA